MEKQFKINLLPRSKECIKAFSIAQSAANRYRYSDRDKYAEIMNDFYKKETARRYNNQIKVVQSEDNVKSVLEFLSIREHIVDMMVDWCWTYDPRNIEFGLPPSIPWIPWQKQIDFIEWFYTLYLNGKRGIIEKSRDAGATWLVCLVFLREWRFVDGFAGGLGSRKLELVDKKDNPKSIFQKLRQLLYQFPTWWLPEGFNRNKHDITASLTNPANGANISGEGGDDIGRGDRRMVYVVDEKAAVEHQELVDSALSQTTNVQIDLSTPRGRNHFGQKRHSGKLPVFTFHWKDDLRKDKIWYEKEKSELDSVIVAQEIDLDYDSSVENLFINPYWIRAAVDLKLDKGGKKTSGLDVAAGGKNSSALAKRRGSYIKVEKRNYKNGIELANWAIEESLNNKSEYMNYDVIGVGHSVYSAVDQLKNIPFGIYAVNANASPSEEYYPELGKNGKEAFFNARAEWWYIASRAFKKTFEYVEEGIQYPHDELISIENDPTLIQQLSSVKRENKNKIKAESKDDMFKRGVESPDCADALVMSLIPQNAGNRFVWPNFDKSMLYSGKLEWYNCYNIVSFHLSKDMVLSLVCAQWNRKTKKLYVYGEILSKDILFREISEMIVRGSKIHENGIRWFLCNNFAEDECRKSVSILLRDEVNKVLRFYTKNRVNIIEPMKFNRLGSIALVNQMMADEFIRVNGNCKNLREQIDGWYIDGGKPSEKGFGLCEALTQIVSELNRTERIRVEEKPIDSYRKIERDEPAKQEKNLWATK